jgi:hypothetical protein
MKAAGINPRTKEPYKRAPYNKEKAVSAAAALHKLEKAKEKATETATRAISDHHKVKELEAKVKQLEALLVAEQDKKHLAVSNAQLIATQGSSAALLQRYRDGLRDGASLSRGGQIEGDTPDQSRPTGTPGYTPRSY